MASLFIVEHLLGKCEGMLQQLYQEAEKQLEELEMQRQYEEYLELVEESRRNREREYDQRRLEEEQPWLPQQDLFAEYEPIDDLEECLLPPAPEDIEDDIYPTEVYETDTEVSEDESILNVMDFSEEIHFSDTDSE